MMLSGISAEAIIVSSRITDRSSIAIGKGGCGNVFKARYDGEPVAIKRSRAAASVFIKAVRDEVAVLSKLSHPRIVRFYGVVMEADGSLGLVLEYMTDGSLYDFYQRKPNNPPSTDDKMRWALDIAYGIQYLHDQQPPIIHRDLKSPNVLMSVEKGSLCAKVSDFGSAITHISRSSQLTSKAQTLVGTTRFYQAPELNAIKVKFTTATDMYAYGIILSEIISWEGPFGCSKENMNYEMIESFIFQGKPIPFDLNDFEVPRDFKDISTKCAGVQESRPSVQEAIDTLRSLKSSASRESQEPKPVPAKNNIPQLSLSSEKSESLTESILKSIGLETYIPANAPSQAGRPDSQRDETINSSSQESLTTTANIRTAMNTATAGFTFGVNNADSDPEYQFVSKALQTELIGFDQSFADAFGWFQVAANQDHAEAQTRLGFCYYYGNGVEQNLDEAVKWFTKSAEQGNADAQDWARELKRTSLKPRNGSPNRQRKVMPRPKIELVLIDPNSLGICYEQGKGVEQNIKEAIKWYTKSAKQGNSNAQHNLGLCYDEGHGVEKDFTVAFTWYNKSAEQGNAQAQYNLGLCYFDGNGVEQNSKEGVKWFTKSAEQGNAGAQYNSIPNSLGVCFGKGDGVQENFEEAVKWFAKSAEQGESMAQYSLGFCYEEGEGIEKDFREAVKWYTKAAEHGNVDAQFRLGQSYYMGRGVEKDISQAIKWFRKSAEQGNADAKYHIGVCYKRGEGVPADSKEAVIWFRESAERDNAQAQYSLGICYYSGEGVEKNYKGAVKWFTISAEQGHVDAQYHLGICYKNGRGVAIDLKEAARWFNKSAEQGNADAKKM
ncbi:hypothetical protein HDU97_007858 [Phlyctochytrium planicorne]|nr:hypothetical protein HDU97_007858 [Phlyctochytrium planicorne]